MCLLRWFSVGLFGALACTLVAAPPESTSAPVLPVGKPVEVKDGAFEGPFRDLTANAEKPGKIDGRLTEAWSDNSDWADVTVKYGVDEMEPHGGKSSQSVAITKVASGAVQLVQRVQFKKGVYAFYAWLRGQPGTSVTLQLRQVGAPSTVYAMQNVTLSAEWRQFSVSGAVTDETEGFLMIVANSPTTFSIDDVRLEDLTDATSNAAPRAGNLITGGSFEAGVSSGWSVRYEGDTGNRFNDTRPSVDKEAATHGKQSLRLEMPAGDNVNVYSPPIHYNANRKHTVSLDLKASEPNTGVRVEIEGTDLGMVANLGPKWERFTFGGVLPFRPFVRFKLNYTLPGGGVKRTLWMDGVQMEEQETASAYQSPFPHELNLGITRPGGVVFEKENEKVLISVGPEAPAGSRLQLSATDLAGKKRDVASVPMPTGNFALPNFAAKGLGMFKLRGELVDKAGKPLSAPVELVWARLPRPRKIEPANSFFGIHIPLIPAYIEMAAATGHRWVRLHDSSMVGKWSIIEGEKGKFQFYDEGVTAAHEAGLAVLGMLDGAPAWASAKPREKGGYWSLWNIPDGTENWQNYVRTAVGHYKGRIDAWEVWNEPWGEWWLGAGGTPEGYAGLLKTAYSTAKETNPEALVIGVDTYRGKPWAEDVLKTSGTECMDGFSFHNYDAAAYGGGENQAQRDAESYNAVQTKYGTPKPLWLTEGGPGGMGSFYLPENGGIEPAQQGAQAVRFDVTQMAAGVKAFFLYAVHADPPMGDAGYNAIEHDRAIKPILAARAVLASLVDGAECKGRREPVPGVDAYDFVADGKKVSIWWSYDGKTRQQPRPKGGRVLDLQGNTLTGKQLTIGPEPIYILE